MVLALVILLTYAFCIGFFVGRKPARRVPQWRHLEIEPLHRRWTVTRMAHTHYDKRDWDRSFEEVGKN